MNSPILIPGQKLELGQAMIGPFKVYKRGFGAFIAAMLMPLAAALVLLVGGSLISMAVVAANPGNTPAAAVAIFIGFYVATIVTAGLLSLKAYGMIIQGTFDIVQGHKPSLGDLWRRTRGVVGRLLVVYLLGLVLALAISAVMMAVMVVPMLGLGMAVDSEYAGAGSAMGMLLGYLLMFALEIGLFVLSIKLMFLMPEVTVQGRDGISAAKRSWTLTQGRFWRLLGYTLLFGVIYSVIYYAVMIVGGFIMVASVLSSIPSLENGQFPVGMVVGLVLFYLVIFAGVFLTLPLVIIFNTLMYAERINETGDTGNAWTYPGTDPREPGGFSGGGSGYAGASGSGGQGFTPPAGGQPQPGQTQPGQWQSGQWQAGQADPGQWQGGQQGSPWQQPNSQWGNNPGQPGGGPWDGTRGPGGQAPGGF